MLRRGHIWGPLASRGPSQPCQDFSSDAEAISGSHNHDYEEEDESDDEAGFDI